jgi:hypothetical protein
MDVREELVQRCATRRREKIGTLSDEGFAELVLAVRNDPAAFVDASAEEAFAALAAALATYEQSLDKDNLLDDDEYVITRTRRLGALADACDRAVAVDSGCTDAQLVSILAHDLGPDDLLARLLELRDGTDAPSAADDAWNDVFSRPSLRLDAAIVRTCLDSSRFRMTLDRAEGLLGVAPSDALGAHYTAALAYARLEDEAGFDALDARFGHRGNTWSNLARVILLYKLGRMPAARRALQGYCELCEGASYALLKPEFVEIYLPDRPTVAPSSFEEAVLAIHESEPVIADVPDFIAWAQSQPWLEQSASQFADKNDFDW